MSDDKLQFLFNNAKFLDHIPNELKCTICKKLMIAASYIECGCEYCYTCICDYLNKGNKVCPGINEDCSNFEINLNTIAKNPVTNRRIIKLKVECTNTLCDYQDSVDKMASHLEYCDKVGKSCPLFEYDCNTSGLNEDELKWHIMDYQVNHSRIFINLINKLNTSMAQLEVKKRQINNYLKEETCRLTNDINELRLTNNEILNNLAKLNVIGRDLERKTNELEEQVSRIEDEMNQIHRNKTIVDANLINSQTFTNDKMKDSLEPESNVLQKDVGYLSSKFDRSNEEENTKISDNSTNLTEENNLTISTKEDDVEISSDSMKLAKKDSLVGATELDHKFDSPIYLLYDWIIENVMNRFKSIYKIWSPNLILRGGHKIQMSLNYTKKSQLSLTVKIIQSAGVDVQKLYVVNTNPFKVHIYCSCLFTINFIEDSQEIYLQFFRKNI